MALQRRAIWRVVGDGPGQEARGQCMTGGEHQSECFRRRLGQWEVLE